MPNNADSLLYSFVLELKPRAEALVSPTHGYQAYSMLLQVLKRRDPSLAAAIHEAGGPKPVTISPLWGPRRRQGSGLLLSPEQTYWLRVTALRDEIFARLLDALASLPAEEGLRLESALLNLERVITTPDKSEWVGCTSFGGLLDDARPQRRLRLRFVTPTVFRSGGKRNLLWPLPELVFGSLLARWNEHSPVPLPDRLRQATLEGVLLARYRLETRMLDFGSYQEAGFEGECEYELSPSLSAEASAQIGALARFAFYAGVGAKTAMGMGQARAAAMPAHPAAHR